MVKIVNIVAAGDLGENFDLYALSTQIQDFEIQYEPEVFPGLQIRVSSTDSVMTIFRTGKYTITGVTSESEVESVFKRVVDSIRENKKSNLNNTNEPVIKNIVCTADLGRELDLSNIAAGLGLNNTEYDPETSAFVYYRPQDVDCVIMISSNGSVSITGVKELPTAERAFDLLQNRIERLFN